MSSVHHDSEVGFEEGMLCLPSHVLDEANHSNVYVRNRHQKLQHQGHRRLPREPWSQYSKSSGRSSYQRPKNATGGPGMQAIFLSSGQETCGTGVFLPQRAGTKPTKKPACAPVLLPARVVQALNLKVHTLGLQISPPHVPKCNARRGEECTNESTKKRNDQKEALSKSSSPDIFLPKEWTY
ncbi:uncharacterized protein LOC130730719 isoform X2 [Lotus japonicus]|uniref:uncharacterized protein LOC130730719 isoform X2 n=1 Tax=Lotus japonicus TaxID=34305 RepID=UPI00258E7F00|nr:uncharacterized protein LOC130730719 isoform X2 [Lotus japonicus]